VLDEETWAAEDLYLGLRSVFGIDAEARLARVSDAARARLRERVEHAVASGLVRRDGATIRLTRRGFLLADTVFEGILTG
jgi:coproporphyrinogen III oxidase-like Fe-S oxidoreductase